MLPGKKMVMMIVLVFIIIRFMMMATFSRNYLTSSFSSSKHLHRLHEKVKVEDILVVLSAICSVVSGTSQREERNGRSIAM